MNKPVVQKLLELLSGFSLRKQYRMADIASFFVASTPNQISRQTRENIRLCFADASPARQKQLQRESIRHTCYSFFELAAVWCWPAQRILDCIGDEQVCDSFFESGKGRIVIAPHLGSWELLNLWLAEKSELLSLYRPPKTRSLEPFVLTSRSRNGATQVPTSNAGLRKLLRGLKQDSTLMLLPDQKPTARKPRLAARFFDLLAPTTTLVQSLCSKLDCDVFIAVARRQRHSGGFSIYLQPLAHARLADEGLASAQYMNDEIEKLVMSNPEQYQWAYRRFSGHEYKKS